jgi:Na+/H+ antiporter NhaD/arsenite permease-like protein
MPRANVVFLFLGAVTANLLGTTGASMLLIRPWIHMNKYRITAHHIVFFIFIVSNAGGCLTPVGDPPLFLGYLKGIPFWWVTEHCWPMWVVGLSALLAIFYAIDSANYSCAPKGIRSELAEAPDKWRFEGLSNLFFLAVILAAVFLESPPFAREAIMVAAAAGSYFTTRRQIHKANRFNFHPVWEVAVLFASIFATMMPALDWLQLNAAKLGVASPGSFYWSSGIVSSALDNAPTYLGFLSAVVGSATHPQAAGQVQHLVGSSEFSKCLLAISIGSVFFGASTYIGNGPNFMVKSIAHQQKVRTPGFLGYVFSYTLPYLLPVLLLIWIIFFRRL